MSINLEKGQRIDLTKSNPGVTKYAVGLGWDVKAGAGDAFDLDASALILKGGKLMSPESVCYFGRLQKDGVSHSGDSLTGEGDGDDEVLSVDFAGVAGDEIVFVVNIYQAAARKQNFGQVANAFIRIFNPDTKEEYFKYDLSEDFSTNDAMIMGRLYNKDNEWKFQAVAEGMNGDLNAVAAKYQ